MPARNAGSCLKNTYPNPSDEVSAVRAESAQANRAATTMVISETIIGRQERTMGIPQLELRYLANAPIFSDSTTGPSTRKVGCNRCGILRCDHRHPSPDVSPFKGLRSLGEPVTQGGAARGAADAPLPGWLAVGGCLPAPQDGKRSFQTCVPKLSLGTRGGYFSRF
jgi:hypothetical protein